MTEQVMREPGASAPVTKGMPTSCERQPAADDSLGSDGWSADELAPPGGSPLADSVRAFFEPRFGHEFSAVRVHTGAQAAALAGSVNALAYTVGQDIVFGAGQYAPETTVGQRLLAHELAHVRQNAPSSTEPVVKRYEAPEHQDIGDAYLQGLLQFLQTDEGERWASGIGMNRNDLIAQIRRDPLQRGELIQLRTDVDPGTGQLAPMRLSAGQIISLMGDLYGSWEALANAPTREISELLSVMRGERLGTISGSGATERYESITGGRYLRLAALNDAHFARQNRREWRRLHEQAVAEARAADGETGFQRALLIDAAAGHFLTDAYAAGHLFAKDEVLAAIALHLRAHPVVAENPAMQTYFGVIGFSGRMPHLVLKNVHDRMNREGFEVTNAKGMRWRTFGDNYLASAQETQRIAALAVFLSRQQILKVRGSATAAADPAEIEALMPSDDTVERATRQAIAYVPDAVQAVENLIYRNRTLAPLQFGTVLGTIIESNIAAIGHPGRDREIMNMLDSAQRIGVEAPIAPSFTIGTF